MYKTLQWLQERRDIARYLDVISGVTHKRTSVKHTNTNTHRYIYVYIYISEPEEKPERESLRVLRGEAAVQGALTPTRCPWVAAPRLHPMVSSLSGLVPNFCLRSSLARIPESFSRRGVFDASSFPGLAFASSRSTTLPPMSHTEDNLPSETVFSGGTCSPSTWSDMGCGGTDARGNQVKVNSEPRLSLSTPPKLRRMAQHLYRSRQEHKKDHVLNEYGRNQSPKPSRSRVARRHVFPQPQNTPTAMAS